MWTLYTLKGMGRPSKSAPKEATHLNDTETFVGDTKDSKIVYLEIEIEPTTDYSWVRVIENTKI